MTSISSPSSRGAAAPNARRHLSIVTGGSRGMGLALVQQLIGSGHHVITLSRRVNDALTLQAEQAGVPLEQWPQDLAQSTMAATRLESWLMRQNAVDWLSATLVNNAGVLSNTVPLAHSDAADLTHALRVGLEAPLLLCSAFLRATAHWTVPRKVLNVSSGLGRRPMGSAAAYCAAKAGMDHFTRCLALEEAQQPNGAKVCSLAPGVIDTDMQIHLRSGDAATFADLPNFIALKAQGQLATPHDAAAKLMAYLARPDFGDHPIGDVRDPQPPCAA